MNPEHHGPAIPASGDLAVIQDLQQRCPWLFAEAGLQGGRAVGQCVAAYLTDQKDEVCRRVYQDRTAILEKFCAAFGERRAADCLPTELRTWIAGNPAWRSGWTRQRVNVCVQRVFNWSVTMRLLRENPFRGVHYPGGGTGRPMTDAEFQALMRASDPHFRRFLFALKDTGARPGELSRLKWSHIDFARWIAVLADHKTARKTGKPRVIVFTPLVLKMLELMRTMGRLPAAEHLRRFLAARGGRAPVRDVVRHMKSLGHSYRSIYCARRALGASYHCEGARPRAEACRHCGRVRRLYRKKLCRRCYDQAEVRASYAAPREHGPRAFVYELPAEGRRPEYDGEEYVFVNGKNGTPWHRYTLSTKVSRLRVLLGLPASCKLYGLRSRFATVAVEAGVNLKVLATLMGHSTTAMLDKHYIHVSENIPFLHQAAELVRRPQLGNDSAHHGGKP